MAYVTPTTVNTMVSSSAMATILNPYWSWWNLSATVAAAADMPATGTSCWAYLYREATLVAAAAMPATGTSCWAFLYFTATPAAASAMPAMGTSGWAYLYLSATPAAASAMTANAGTYFAYRYLSATIASASAMTSPIIATVYLSGTAVASSAMKAIPFNDAFANAIVLTGESGQTLGINIDATLEVGEPVNPENEGGASVWWKITSPDEVDMFATIDTNGSNFDTILAVYTGETIDNLTLIASDDDGGNSVQSLVSFLSDPNTPYKICVDGYSGDTGNIVLNWVFLPLYLYLSGTIVSSSEMRPAVRNRGDYDELVFQARSFGVPYRPNEYDPEAFWDEETETWIASRELEKEAGGRHKNILVAISDNAQIYYGGF